LRKAILSIALALMLLFVFAVPIFAATSADVTVTATPAFISISVLPIDYDFGTVAESATPETTTSYFTITNSSSVVTDNTVGVTTSAWSGGIGWTHSDTCTPGTDTAGLKANKGGTWGTGDVIVKFNSPNILADDQAITTNWSFGLKLYAPTVFNDGVEKSIIVRITATQAA